MGQPFKGVTTLLVGDRIALPCAQRQRCAAAVIGIEAHFDIRQRRALGRDPPVEDTRELAIAFQIKINVREQATVSQGDISGCF